MGKVSPWISPILSLFGGDDKSRTDDVNYPDYFNDPHFTGSQDFLDQYSKDLLTQGPNNYYAPIGQYGTPEFLGAMNAANHATMAGTADSSARYGRGGREGEIAAQAIGDQNAKLLYADYERAMQGRQHFFDTGLNVQDSVRNAGFANQGERNKFNQSGADFDFNKAKYGDAYDYRQSQDVGKMIGAVAPIAGAGLGFMMGGPAGASMGYGIGNSLFGGTGETPAWLDILNNQKGLGGTKTAGSEDIPNGVSTLGRINPEDFLKMYSPGWGGG